MRLTVFEIEVIKASARRHFGDEAVVRLFGSRVNDDLSGGDVDLHIEAESSELATLSNELAFRKELRSIVGDQKIDVVLRPPSYSPRAIDQIAHHTGVLLP